MKEYVVLEIKCDKDLTIADIYAEVTKRVVHNRNSFFVDSLHVDSMRDSNKRRYDELYEELNLEQFMYTVTLENRPDHPWHLISNLDASWEWCNPNVSESLPQEQFEKLIDFLDNLKAVECLWHSMRSPGMEVSRKKEPTVTRKRIIEGCI